MIYANIPFYQKEVESLSPTRLNLLKAIANGETQLTSTRVVDLYKLGTPNNVLKNKKILIEEDIVDESSDVLVFLDPAFEFWFRKQFFAEDWGIN